MIEILVNRGYESSDLLVAFALDRAYNSKTCIQQLSIEDSGIKTICIPKWLKFVTARIDIHMRVGAIYKCVEPYGAMCCSEVMSNRIVWLLTVVRLHPMRRWQINT